MTDGPRIGLVAGEASGDALGAALMEALRRHAPGVSFVGVGGPAMRAAGLESLHRTEALSMNGFVDPLLRLPELYRLLHRLRRRFSEAGLDAFVGIDFNVFNLLLERRLKDAGMPVAHYVSPSVYAWRRGRVRTVARAADRLLALFPFEAPFYADTDLTVDYVGHPLADALAPPTDVAAGRAALGLAGDATVLAVLPGSRASELRRHTGPFLEAAVRLRERAGPLEILVPVLDEAGARWVADVADRIGVAVRVETGRSREVLACADLALVKAGTGTLEAMLLGVPMVVAYRLGAVTHAALSRLVHTPFFALPNILADRALVPELIQDAATPDALAAALADVRERASEQRDAFATLAAGLRVGGADRAARAVLALAGAPRGAGS